MFLDVQREDGVQNVRRHVNVQTEPAVIMWLAAVNVKLDLLEIR